MTNQLHLMKNIKKAKIPESIPASLAHFLKTHQGNLLGKGF